MFRLKGAAYSDSPDGTPNEYVSQPAFIEAVVTELDGLTWKLAMYYENTDFSNAPLSCTCSEPIAPPPLPDTVQFEIYDLSNDPIEAINLADSTHATSETRAIQAQLFLILQEQLTQKALHPSSASEPNHRLMPPPS